MRSANASEKDARAALYGAVKRVLSPRDIVILDTLNYIKGWRYQLYCEAKNVQTPFGLVQVGCPVARARGVNEARIRRLEKEQQEKEGQQKDESSKTTRKQTQTPSTTTTTTTTTTAAAGRSAPKSGDLHPETYQQSHQNWQQKQFEEESEAEGPDYEEDITLGPNDVQEPYLPRSNWENLVFRYEEPNPMTRWDSPLFILTWTDTPDDARKVFDQIWDEVIVNKPQKLIRANKSTVQRDKDPGGDYLYVLEKETQDIVKRLLEQQSEVGEGGTVRLSRSGKEGGEEMLEVELPGKKVGLPQLQRYRRAFVALNRGGIGLEAVGTLAAGRLRESFVGYLNDAFEKEM